MEKKYPIYPTLEQGTYSEELEKSYNEAEERARKQEEKARADRDIALIGDMAHLFSQSAAMHGGAWKVDKTNSTAAAGNEKLRALQERNIAQTAQFAKERAALRDAKRKEENAAKVAQYNAEVEQYKRNLDEERRAEDVAHRDKVYDETVRHNQALEELRRQANKGLSQRGGGSDMALPNVAYDRDGTPHYFKSSEAALNHAMQQGTVGYYDKTRTVTGIDGTRTYTERVPYPIKPGEKTKESPGANSAYEKPKQKGKGY